MIGTRHSSRPRVAITGKNKSDVIDSEVLTHAGEIFGPAPLILASPGSWRCGGPWSDGPVPSLRHRYWRRLLSLARLAFPDVWSAFAGSESTALAVLGRWTLLRSLASARVLRSLASARAATLTAMVAEHTRNVAGTPARAAAIKTAARGWADFWEGTWIWTPSPRASQGTWLIAGVPGQGGALHLLCTPVVGVSLRR
jgi:hypothetical protein